MENIWRREGSWILIYTIIYLCIYLEDKTSIKYCTFQINEFVGCSFNSSDIFSLLYFNREKEVKPPRRLFTEDGRPLNVNEPK